MKGLIAILIGILAVLLVVGGAVAFTVLGHSADDVSVEKIADKVSEVTSSVSDEVSSGGDNSSLSDIVSEEVKFNAQNGEGYYREVTYKDGGFRQYDTESGDLIGSSYDSDQDSLPSME